MFTNHHLCILANNGISCASNIKIQWDIISHHFSWKKEEDEIKQHSWKTKLVMIYIYNLSKLLVRLKI
jgi:hypothetical protein